MKETLYLYLCKSEVMIPIVAKDEDDALIRLNEEYEDIVSTVFNQVPEAIENEVLDRVHSLSSDSMWEGYYPHGDYYGPQETCRYYTLEAHQEREEEENRRYTRVREALEGLSSQDLECLKELLLSDSEKELLSKFIDP
jgi:hypothetical protein